MLFLLALTVEMRWSRWLALRVSIPREKRDEEGLGLPRAPLEAQVKVEVKVALLSLSTMLIFALLVWLC